jgi:hypothetical protein
MSRLKSLDPINAASVVLVVVALVFAVDVAVRNIIAANTQVSQTVRDAAQTLRGQ